MVLQHNPLTRYQARRPGGQDPRRQLRPSREGIHLHKEIGILKWYRRTTAQLARIRDFIQAKRWLALAKWLRELGRERTERCDDH